MELLVFLAFFVIKVSSIELKLPLEGNEEDFNVTLTRTKLTMEDGTTINCELGMYESKNNIPITKIRVGSIDLFNSTSLITPGFRRWVYEVRIRNKQLIIIISKSNKVRMEECYLIVDSILYSLIDLDVGMEDVFGGYNAYSVQIKSMLHQILSLITSHSIFEEICKDVYTFDVCNIPLQGRNIELPEYHSLTPLEISEADWEEAGPSQQTDSK